jgi:hypothetical protein
MMKPFKIDWLDSGREPQCAPDKRYPNGIDLDMSGGRPMTCITDLPYPAPRCGLWRVTCNTCGYVVAVTAAGRVDDPRSVRIPCDRKKVLQ